MALPSVLKSRPRPATGSAVATIVVTSVAAFMRLLGYSLQANVKTKEGAAHPDRDQ